MEILDAARVVLGSVGPDRASLREVAAQAGVSHGLITHYFGTFDALVEQTLQRQVSELRARLLDKLETDAANVPALVDFLFEQLADPVHGRLLAWAVLSGRLERTEFFPRKRKGLRAVAAAVAGENPTKDHSARVDALIILVWCSALGYSVGSSVLWEALGREPSEQRDADYRRLVATLVEHVLSGAKE